MKSDPMATRSFKSSAFLALFVATFTLPTASPALAQSNTKTERTAEEIYQSLQKTYSHNLVQDPELERKAFEVHPEFEVNLFAASPWVVNPIAMTWDAQGRLWVINSPMYPQILPGQDPTDFISVLEDRNDDGKADKCTVFYDKLYVPTGLEVGDGGVYVANQPDLLFLKDRDGDLRADSRKVLLSGFGTEDNHHAISAFTWCPGGWLYFESGIFLHTQVETPHGLVRLDNGGVFQLKPRDLRLELFNVGTATNPWGHAFDKWGQSFLTEGPQGGIWWLTPGTVSTHPDERVPQTTAPKSCGVEFIYSSHFSDNYQGMMALNAFKNKTVNLYAFSDDGAGFATKELQPLLIVSKEQNFRPVDVKVGPDGALYILDFFQPVIGHMQYEFRDPRRDHLNGRVWRITQKGRPLLKKPSIVGASADELAENLKSKEGFVRNKSRRQLYEIDAKSASAALDGLLKGLDAKDPEFDRHRLETLWAYQTIDVVKPELLAEVLASREPKARAAAVRVLRYWRDQIPNALELLAKSIDDDSPRVRLETLCALSYFPSLRAMELAARAADRPMDRFLEYTFKHTAAALKDLWLPALQAGKIDFGGNANRVQAALSAIQQRDAASLLLKMLQDGKVAPERREGVAVIVASLGTAGELAQIFDPALLVQLFPSHGDGRTPDPAPHARVLMALTRAARERKVKPDVSADAVAALLRSDNEILRAEALALAGAWKLGSLHAPIAAAAGDAEAPRSIRSAAIEALAEIGEPECSDVLNRMSAVDNPPDIRCLAAGALSRIDIAAACRRAVEILESSQTAPDYAPLLDAILSRKDGEKNLSDALAGKKLNSDAAKLALRSLNASGKQPAQIVDLLRSAVGTGSLTAQLGTEDINKLIAEIEQHGDPARGESVFRRKDLACQSCHAISGGGPAVGPDLEGLGTSSPMDYLVHSVLDPNKAIREGFAAVTVLTTSGNVYTGILKSKSDAELVILDATTREQRRIPTADIDEVANSPSIMPKGLVDNMTRGEFLDLVRFIRELGRSGPYATRNVPVIRTWRYLDSVSETGLNHSDDLLALASRADANAWKPVYSRVSGVLETADLERGPIAIVRARIDVGTAGKIGLKINDTAGLTLWVDDKPADISSITTIDVAQGVRTLTFIIDSQTRNGAGLQVFVEDVPGSAARARIIDGY